MKTYNLNQITIDHINHLSDIELSQLLHALLKMEAEKNNLEDWDRSVPLNITTGDEGSDGRIQWKGKPTKTKWLKNKYIVFQNKATALPPSKCKEELLKKIVKNKPRKLKSEIEKVVKAKGCYILFTNEPIVDKGKRERITEFRKALKLTKHANHETFQIAIYDSNLVKDWVNENIGAITLVQTFNGITRPAGFMDWRKWEIISRALDNGFKMDSTITTNKALIEKSIKTEKVIRITGHSGLGKTRLVLEAFRESELKDSIVYCDLQGNDDISELKNYIISHQDHQDGIIVIDNCDFKSHIILSELIKAAGSLKIITVGLDDSSSIQDLKIKLEKNKQRDIVKEIITSKLQDTHTPSDIEYINTISEGYPGMAIRFCDIVRKEGMSELNKIPIDEFIRKLIFGLSPENEIEYEVIRACSVFSAFGFLDDSFKDVINDEIKQSLKAQMKFIRTRVIDGNVTETKFNQICNKFLAQDIIERRGKFYIVKPTILAINLAANWLLSTDSDRIIEIIQELKEVKLDERFLERFKDLDQIDKAKDIVAELWGPKSPFGSAEVLNTHWGSLLFRYVVEVNPVSTTRTLVNAFGNKSKEEIMIVDDGRRNLVWAIEKLCFRKESFSDASKVLYSFAVSENETIGNNATNQFRQLFHVLLPGTEANLKQRIEVIKWGLAKNDDTYTNIAVQAMGSGLTYDHFSRMGGAERQGGGAPLKDYIPQPSEIVEYWELLINLLTEIACSNNANSDIAKTKIANSIRTLISNGQFKLMQKAIKSVISSKGNFWSEALTGLKMTLSFEKHLLPEIKSDIRLLINELSPSDIKTQLILKVTKPTWDEYEKDENEHYIDKQKLNAEAFAVKIVDENIDWTEYLPDLLKGEQIQGFNFGRKIGELSENGGKILSLVIKQFQKIKPDEQNPELIAGILAGIKDRKVVEETIDKFTRTKNLRKHAFYLVRVINPSFKDIEKLFVLVDKYGYEIDLFRNFQYGRSLDQLTNKEVIDLCERIAKYGKAGKWTSLSLLFMFCFGNTDCWSANKDFFRKLLSSENLLISENPQLRLEGYHWSEAVNKILNSSDAKDFAITISKHIVEFCNFSSFNYSLDIYVRNVIAVLFDKYFNTVWPYFGEGIVGDYMVFSHIENMIGSENGNLGGKLGFAFISSDRYEIIFEWCKDNPGKAVERIAHMMPLSSEKDGKVTWHPFSKKFIDEFGDNEKVISQLNSNMGTYGTVGSRVPYFLIQKQLFQELIHHHIPRVKDWAIEMLAYTEKLIKRERIDDEEHFL